MALDARIHYRTFARIDRTPAISSRYWTKLFDTYKVGLNFDGELFGLGDRFEALIEAGFRWKNEDSSEICLNTTKGRADWLQNIRVVPDDLTIEPFEAWTIEGSRCEFVQCPADIADQIGGWATDGIGQGYGSGYPIEVLHRWLSKIVI